MKRVLFRAAAGAALLAALSAASTGVALASPGTTTPPIIQVIGSSSTQSGAYSDALTEAQQVAAEHKYYNCHQAGGPGSGAYYDPNTGNHSYWMYYECSQVGRF
ncbi:hypothetical protein ABT117_31205 [Streptomyces sp. NPDC002262]|uniref:hypothetical protein n=1 Tax=Streptomyces sp. NPDC002262 TaxID=3154414 RepID=UPI00332D24A2